MGTHLEGWRLLDALVWSGEHTELTLALSLRRILNYLQIFSLSFWEGCLLENFIIFELLLLTWVNILHKELFEGRNAAFLVMIDVYCKICSSLVRLL